MSNPMSSSLHVLHKDSKITTNIEKYPENPDVRLATAALLVLLDKGQVLVDVIRGADHEGNPLVERFRLNLQYPLSAGGGEASRLLDEESDGVALVEQPQLYGKDLKKKALLCFVLLKGALHSLGEYNSKSGF